jgi:hypothetical protein
MNHPGFCGGNRSETQLATAALAEFASVGYPAGFRAKLPFECQLSGEDEFPLLAESVNW